jgi:hypothetical protein
MFSGFGWIKNVKAGWEITKVGKSIGGRLFEPITIKNTGFSGYQV